MRTSIQLTLAAGLSISGISAAAADADPCDWRWYVTNALRAQQNEPPPPPLLREGRASALETDDRFVQRYQRYFADGSPAPLGDPALR